MPMVDKTYTAYIDLVNRGLANTSSQFIFTSMAKFQEKV